MKIRNDGFDYRVSVVLSTAKGRVITRSRIIDRVGLLTGYIPNRFFVREIDRSLRRMLAQGRVAHIQAGAVKFLQPAGWVWIPKKDRVAR